MKLLYFSSSTALAMLFASKFLLDLNFSVQGVKNVAMSIGIVSATVIVALTIWSLVTFPGYFDPSGL